MDLFSLVATLKLDKSGFDEGIDQASKTAGGFGEKFTKNVGKAVKAGAAAASAAIVAFGKSSIDAGMQFDKSMSQVAATMGTTVDNIQQLRDFALDMGSKTSFSASEAADALNYMALAGYDAETSMKMLPNVLNLAAAGGIDLASASDMVTDASSALGLSLDETSEMVDMMAKASSMSNTSVAQLGQAFLTVGGTAKTLTYGTNELASMLGVLADNGIKGAEGGTALRNIILSLTAPTDKAAMAMERLGLEIYDDNGDLRRMDLIFGDLNERLADMSVGERTQVLSDIFNKVDLKSVNALMATSSERFAQLSEGIAGAWYSSQSLTAAFANVGLNMEDMRARMAALGITTEEFDTALNYSGGDASMFAEVLAYSADSGTTLDDVINGLGASLDDIDTAFRQTTGAAQAMADTQLDNLAGDVTLFKSALEGVKIAISDRLAPSLRKFLQDVTKRLPELQESLGDIIVAVGNVATFAVNALLDIISALSDFIKWLSSGSASAEAFKVVVIALTSAFVAFKTAMAIQGVIQNVTQAFGLLNTVLNANPIMLIVSAIALLVTGLVTLYNKCEWFRNGVDAIFGWIKDAVTWIVDKVKLVGEKIAGLCQAIGGWFADARNKVETAWSNIGDWFAEKRERINEKFANVREWFSEKFTNARNAVQTAWQNVGSWFQQRRNDIDNAFLNMHTWFQQKGQAAWSLMKGAFTDPKGTFEKIKGGIQSAMGNIDTWLGQKFGQGWTNIKNAFGNVKSWFSNLWSQIKGAIKLPHFKIEGKFSLNPISVPHLAVDWYRKAYENPFVFSQPTVFGGMGFGDGPGGEIVYGHQNLMQDIAAAMRSVMGGTGFTQNLTINSPTRLDPSEIARQTRNANREMVLALRGV